MQTDHTIHQRLRTVVALLCGLLLAANASSGLAASSTATDNATDIVINEIMQNPSVVSDSAGEWLELHNTGSAPVDINGWTIQDSGSDSHVISNGGPLVIPAGGYLVLGRNGDSGTNGGVTVDYEYGSGWFLANGDDEVILLDQTLTEIDRVEYDGGPNFPDPNGASMSLNDPASDNNLGSNWCTATTTFGSGDAGTPGAANDCGGSSGGDPANPGDVVINEIIQNPSAVSDSAGEWFELVNVTGSPINIDGWTIKDNGSDNHVINNGGPLVIPAGGYLVLGRNGDTGSNGGVAVDYVYSGVFLANGDDEVILDDVNGTEIDRVEYDGGPNFPDPNGASMSLVDVTLDNNVGGNWCTASTPFGAGDLGTPGAANDCPGTGGGPAFGVCGDGLETPVSVVQGNGSTSPLVNEIHVIEGVVVGDFQNPANSLGGFFLQEENADEDGNPATSEGIFVFDNGFGVDVSAGDVVRVKGLVTEFFDLTEVKDVTDVAVCAIGASVTPTAVTLPVADLADWEPLEGMLVTFPQTLYVTDNFNQGRFGEVELSVNDRLSIPTNEVEPGPAALALQDLNDRSRIQIDDASTIQNPLTLPYFEESNTLRAGDTLDNLTGVLGYSFGRYEVQPTTPVDFTRVNQRTAAPDPVGGSVTVASMNLLNYFTTLDGSGPICGPSGNLGCRGADNAIEFTRQRDKLIAALAALDADVVGLVELENNASTAISDLVTGLNASVGAGTYDFIDTGTIGSDAIKVGLIYKPAVVGPLGGHAILDSSVNPLFIDSKSRPVLAQTFAENASGEQFTVAVNHLKSKGSPCNDVGDPDAGDGQGNCNGTRTQAAQALMDWLATDPTGSGDPDFLIIGDLNAYALEDPIDAIKAGADDTAGTPDDYTDLIDLFVGPDAYSFTFFGQAGYLDHALASPALVNRVTGVTEWHINADEPRALDYNDFNQPALYSPDPYRSADHDPVLVGLCEAVPPNVTVAVSPDVLWPPNHKMKSVSASVGHDEQSATIALLSVTSNEPDNGTGDGDTANDIVIHDDFTFDLRAERSGSGNGRVYTITYQVTDACGNSTIASAQVTVPHNQGNGKKPKSSADEAANSLIPQDMFGIFLPSVQR